MLRFAIIALIMGAILLAGCATDMEPQAPAEPAQPEEPSNPDPTTTAPSRTPSDMVPRISVDELLHKMQSGADIVIVDAREEPEIQYNEEHIAGAVSAPLSAIAAGEWRPSDLDQEIILYCS